MLVYPQLATGALSQYPVKKRRQLRTVANTLADGSTVKLADSGVEVSEWELRYSGLSDSERAALEQFFTATEGELQGFTFLDPAGNLFARSGDLGHAVWEKDPMLAVTGGAADPAGGTAAWTLCNSGAAAQSICQTLPAPAGYLYCLSVYARAGTAMSVALLRESGRASVEIGPAWRRIRFAGTETAPAESIRFGLEVPAGATIEVHGFQVEPQAGASGYKATARGGVYEGARFAGDGLTVTATDVNCHAATVNIIHAKHL